MPLGVAETGINTGHDGHVIAIPAQACRAAVRAKHFLKAGEHPVRIREVAQVDCQIVAM